MLRRSVCSVWTGYINQSINQSYPSPRHRVRALVPPVRCGQVISNNQSIKLTSLQGTVYGHSSRLFCADVLYQPTNQSTNLTPSPRHRVSPLVPPALCGQVISINQSYPSPRHRVRPLFLSRLLCVDRLYQSINLTLPPGTVYAHSSRLFRVDGATLPYAWNHTITYDMDRGRMPYLVQQLNTQALDVKILPEQTAVRFQLEAAIAPGGSLD